MSETVNKFASLFTGYKNRYVVHIPPFVDTGDGKVKATGGKVPVRFAKINGEYLRLEKNTYKEHLEGIQGLAVSPLMPKDEGVRDHCFFAVIDIDIYNSGIKISQIEELLSINNIPAMVANSKSGGFHIYFFFKKAEPAKEVRVILKQIAYQLGFYNLWDKKKVEIIPEYDVATDKNAKCILLPFFNNLGKPLIEFVARAGKRYTTVDKLKSIIVKTKYSFLPVCIESILNAGTFSPVINRNNVLFSIAVFLCKFWPDNARELFWEIADNFISEDFDKEEVKVIFDSAVEKDYSPLGRCKTAELSEVCDKSICRLRQFENGEKILESKEKKRVLTNIDFGQLYKYNSLNPFYVWELRVADKENKNYIPVQFDNIDMLLNQKAAQGQMGKVIDSIFISVKTDIWEKHVNDALQKVITLDVALLADTTEQAIVARNIYMYLIETEYPHDEPDCILQGYSYKKDGMYYFLTESLFLFLNARKVKLKNTNLYMLLMNLGARVKNINGIDVWEFTENNELIRMTEARKRIRAIESKRLLIVNDN